MIPASPVRSWCRFPSIPTCTDKSAQLAEHVVHWLRTPAEYRRRVEQLVGLRSRFCKPGATRQAAEYILHALERSPRSGIVTGGLSGRGPAHRQCRSSRASWTTGMRAHGTIDQE